MAMFLSQKDNTPFQANGPSNDSAVNVAGTNAAATARLKYATHGLNTGCSCWSQ